MDYAQAATVEIVVLTGKTVHTEVSAMSCTSKVDHKSSSVLLFLSLLFIDQGHVVNLCANQRPVYEGTPAPTMENTTVLVAQIHSI